MAYPRYQLARAHKFARRSSGDVTISSTTNVTVDSGLDHTLAGQVGDTIEALLNVGVKDEAGNIYFDVATVVSGSPVNFFSSGAGTAATSGVSGWYGPASVDQFRGGSVFYTLQSGDIASGLVTVRLVARVSGSTRVVRADSAFPLHFAAKNLGPSDPH